MYSVDGRQVMVVQMFHLLARCNFCILLAVLLSLFWSRWMDVIPHAVCTSLLLACFHVGNCVWCQLLIASHRNWLTALR